MARIRTVKPELFLNEDLAELSIYARMLFIGLFTQADVRGRLEDRHRRLKAALFPYDDVDIDALLDDLHEGGFIVRYEVDGQRLIQVINFEKHQRISGDEAKKESVYPKYQVDTTDEADKKQVRSTDEAGKKTGKEGKGRERKGKEEETSSSSVAEVMLPTASPSPPEQEAMTTTERFSIFDFRAAFHQATGELMPGGLNNEAVDLCLRHPRDKLTAAFEQMARHGGKTFAYLNEVLKGKPKAVVEDKTKSTRRTEANVAAAQEALRLVREEKYGSRGTVVDCSAGVGGNAGSDVANRAAAVVSAGVG